MPVPPPPKPSLDRPPPSVWWAGYALFGMLIAAGVAVLGVISFGSIFAVLILVGLVLPIIVLFHYVLWGWWLGKAIRDAGEREHSPLHESFFREDGAAAITSSDDMGDSWTNSGDN